MYTVMSRSFIIFCAVSAVVVVTVVSIVSVQNQANNQTNVEEPVIDDELLNARSFLDKPQILLSVISKKSSIRGITVLNSELFVVRNGSSQVVIYNTNNFTWSRNIKITGSSYLWAIVASTPHNCLYVSDVRQNAIYRYNVFSRVITQWSLEDTCYGLSITNTYNVLVTLWNRKQIVEYTPEGSFVRAISLDSSIENPWHSIQLSNDFFVVSHGETPGSLHRVCTVNKYGSIIQGYGGAEGSGFGELNQPRNLAADGYGNVLVADRNNNRIVLLSSSLTHLGYIIVPGRQLSGPYDLHLDQLNHRLYIGERDIAGRLCILTVPDISQH